MYKNELAQAQAVFDAASTSAPTGDGAKKPYTPAFPVGEKSQAIITEATVGMPPWPNDDRIFLKIELTHPMTDRSESMFLPLVNLTERAAGWVKSQLGKLNYDTDATPLADIEDHTDEFIGLTVEIYCKRNDRGKVQYYINKVMDEPRQDPSDFAPVGTAGLADDDIPF